MLFIKVLHKLHKFTNKPREKQMAVNASSITSTNDIVIEMPLE